MPDRHRNPVTYVADPVEQRTCACGCDGPVTGGRVFLPGHDQRAIHERIARQWGDTLGSLRDSTTSPAPDDHRTRVVPCKVRRRTTMIRKIHGMTLAISGEQRPDMSR